MELPEDWCDLSEPEYWMSRRVCYYLCDVPHEECPDWAYARWVEFYALIKIWYKANRER